MSPAFTEVMFFVPIILLPFVTVLGIASGILTLFVRRQSPAKPA